MWHGAGHGSVSQGDLDNEILGRVYDHQVVTGLLVYLRPHKLLVVLAIVAMLIYSITTVAVPKLVQHTVDHYILLGDAGGLNIAGLLFLLVIVVNYAANYIYLRALARLSQRLLFKLRTKMFDHLQALSLSFFDRTEVGRIMSRVQNDVLQLQEFLSIVVLTLGDLLSLIGIVVVMLVMDWQLASLTFVVIPALVLAMIFWQRFARAAYVRVRRAIAVVNAGLQENISGVRVIQSLNREDLNLYRFDRVNYEHLDANLSASKVSALLMPLVEILMAVAFGLVVVVGGKMVLGGNLEPGVMVAFALYIQRFFDPIRNLTMQYTMMQRAMTSGVRIFELLSLRPEVNDSNDAIQIPTLIGKIELENVSFSYQSGAEVIREVSLSIPEGNTVALVGPTGAGKTTLVNLIARSYDVTSGRVLVDGYDVRTITRNSLASQLGVVLQEPFLFSTTVWENIRYRRREATNEDIETATMALGAHEFIARLPQGYDTVLHERGGNLSMGQRQLISFARALVADPRILILDEATASIDTHTEVLLQRALKQLLLGRTAIVIAHRLSTIQEADLIVALDHGTIVEMGKHFELVSNHGLYARLYNSNFGDGSLDETSALDKEPGSGD